MSGQSQWKKIFDEESGTYYYYDSQTKETRWDAPKGYVEPSETPVGTTSGDDGDQNRESVKKGKDLKDVGLAAEALGKRLAAKLGIFYVLLGGLLLGGAAAAVTYLLFPAAITTLAVLLGLSGPLALIVPLVSVGVIGALFGMELLAFLEERLTKGERLNHTFMRNLVIFCALVGGIALGVFLLASTPAVAGLLSFAAAAPGLAGVILPYVIAAAASLLVTGLIGYALYRTSGMQKEQARLVKDKEQARLVKDKERLSLYDDIGALEEDAMQILGLSVSGSNPREVTLTPLQTAQELLFIGEVDKLNYVEILVKFSAITPLSPEVKLQRDLVRMCGTKYYHPADLNRDLLIYLALAINSGYSKEACVFALMLVMKKDPNLGGRNPDPSLLADYGRLLDCIKKDNKSGAFAMIRRINLDVPTPNALARLGGGEQKVEAPYVDTHAASYGSHPFVGEGSEQRASVSSQRNPHAAGLGTGGRRPSQSVGDGDSSAS